MMTDWNDQWNHMDGAWSWIGGAMMIGWMLLILVAIVALVLWVLRSGGRTDRGSVEVTPREVIDVRYARGEIDEDQRRNMIETLT